MLLNTETMYIQQSSQPPKIYEFVHPGATQVFLNLPNALELKPFYCCVLTFLSASSTSLTASPAPSLGFFSFFPLPFFAPAPFFFAPMFLD